MPSSPAAPSIRKSGLAGVTLLEVSGPLDERFDPVPVFSEITGMVVIDLGGVSRITSGAVRQWIRALAALGGAPYVGLVKCTPDIVTQLNSVTGFSGNAEVLSFLAPYVCSECGEGYETLIEVQPRYPILKAMSLPDAPCPKCGKPGEFDDIPQSYLYYVASAPEPSPPPAVVRALKGSPAEGVPFRAEKDLAGELNVLWLSGNLDATAHFKRLGSGLEGDVLVVLDGLLRIEPEGLARFRKFLADSELALWAARMPLALAEALSPQELERLHLLSVRVPLRCPLCGAQGFADYDGTQPTRPCGECAQAVALAAPSCLLRGAEAVRLHPAPPAMADYLRTKAQAPTFQIPTRAGVTPTGTPTQTQLAGETFGRYQLLRPLGAGGMAEVFLGLQVGIAGFEKKVVIKRILPHLNTEKTFVELFLQEARLAARINSPYVVQIFDVGQAGARHFIAMEYVRGWDLAQVLRAAQLLSEPMPVGVALRIASDVCKGLHAAHGCADDDGRALGIIHRDVSPHNILLSSEGQAKLTDFGIAKAVDSLAVTPTASFRGKVGYSAPEQITHGGPIDARADLFSTGVVLYQCLAGRPPFRRSTEMETMVAVVREPAVPLEALRPGVPASVADLAMRSLAKSPDARFASAKDFDRALETALHEVGGGNSSDVAAWAEDVTRRSRAVVNPSEVLEVGEESLLTGPKEYRDDEATPVVEPTSVRSSPGSEP